MPRILLVEDDPAVRLLWADALVDANYEVDTTETVAGGCEFLGVRVYDLVVADGRLPDGTGMIVADRASERNIPALIVTGYTFISDDVKGDPPKYNLLLKPIRPNELLEVIATTLSAA
jgi:DNA-binding response OmpR family regulator